MFKTMYSSINHEVASLMFKLEPPPESARPRSVFSDIAQSAVHQEFFGISTGQPGLPIPKTPQQAALQQSMPEENPRAPALTPVRSGPKVGRNDPCPCGSGKKYKKCCGH